MSDGLRKRNIKNLEDDLSRPTLPHLTDVSAKPQGGMIPAKGPTNNVARIMDTEVVIA